MYDSMRWSAKPACSLSPESSPDNTTRLIGLHKFTGRVKFQMFWVPCSTLVEQVKRETGDSACRHSGAAPAAVSLTTPHHATVLTHGKALEKIEGEPEDRPKN